MEPLDTRHDIETVMTPCRLTSLRLTEVLKTRQEFPSLLDEVFNHIIVRLEGSLNCVNKISPINLK